MAPGGQRTSAAERIVTLDILRGLALLGMILVHFHQNMEIEGDAPGLENLVGWIVWMGVEAKAWATFAILFGAGFAIFIRRAEARGRNVVPLFLRRLFVLAVIGVAVLTLFGFTILLDYALWGVALLLVRNWSTRALVILIFASAVATTVAGVARSAVRISQLGPERAALVAKAAQQENREHWNSLKKAETEGTYGDAVRVRAAHIRWSYLKWSALIPSTNFVLFLIGLLAIREGIFSDAKRHRTAILAAMSAGLLSWVMVWFVLEKIPNAEIGGVQIPFSRGLGIFNDQWLGVTYVGAVTLLLAYRPEWKRRLSIVGSAGRMALTNYVAQAAIISWLAAGYGLSLDVRPYYVVLATFTLFALLAALSRLWLSRFNYGPLEWLWRSLTYGEWEPMSVKLQATSPSSTKVIVSAP